MNISEGGRRRGCSVAQGERKWLNNTRFRRHVKNFDLYLKWKTERFKLESYKTVAAFLNKDIDRSVIY